MRALVAVRPEPHRVRDVDGNADPYRWQLRIDDRVSLEAALETAAEVVAVGIGGESAEDCVRSALERGVDEGIHVAFDPVDRIAGEKYATVLARVAARESPDVVFVGETDVMAGPEIAVAVAEKLDWPSGTRATELGNDSLEVAVETGDDELAVQRKLAIGRQEVVVVGLPAVIGVDAGYANPRRASLDTVVSGRRKTIDRRELADVAPSESRFSMSVGAATVEQVTPNQRWGRGQPPREGTVESRIYRMLGRGEAGTKSSGERVDAPPEEAAERVVAFLRERELL